MPKNLSEVEVIVHTALQEAVKKDDARLVLAVILTEAAALARAIKAGGKMEAHQLAHAWGTSLTEALEPQAAKPSLNG